MSITLPAELLEAVIERANRANITRSAWTVNALTAYLDGSISESPTGDNTEVIRLRAVLEGKDEIITSKNETISALRLALDIRNVTGEPREIEDEKHDSDLEKRSLKLLEANNSISYPITKKKCSSRSLENSETTVRDFKLWR